MKQIKHILAVTDLSVAAPHACERAADLAKTTGATFDLLHIVDPSYWTRSLQFLSGMEEKLKAQALDTAKEKLSELAASLAKNYTAPRSADVIEGSLLDVLQQRIQRDGVGLLVCGSKGENRVRSLLIGTTALRMLGSSLCPILMVKNSPRAEYRRGLAALDFSESSIEALRLAHTLLPRTNIIPVHVYEVPFDGRLRYARVSEEALSQYRNLAGDRASVRMNEVLAGLPGDTQVSAPVLAYGTPGPVILDLEQELDCDLIVLGRGKQEWINSLTLGSIAHHLAAASASDVLIAG